MTFISIKS